MPYDRIMPDRVAENGLILHRKEHEWYWLSRQTPVEPMAFVVWDSDDYDLDDDSQKTPGMLLLKIRVLVFRYSNIKTG